MSVPVGSASTDQAGGIPGIPGPTGWHAGPGLAGFAATLAAAGTDAPQGADSGHTSAQDPATDDGSAPPALAAVLAEHAAGHVGIREVVLVLAGERLLVPLLEVSGDLLEGSDTDPCSGQDRAVAAVSVRTPEGTVGLGFTSLAALAHWNRAARPWPTPAPRVAAALLAEGGARLVIDAGSDLQVAVAGEGLRRLASGAAWPDPWADPAVRDAVVAVLAPVLASGEVAVRLAAPERRGAPEEAQAALVVEVAFPAGTAGPVAEERAAIIARRLGDSADLLEVFDGRLLVRPVVRGSVESARS